MRQTHARPTTSAGAGRSVPPVGARRHSHEVETMLALQRSAGNAGVSRLIDRQGGPVVQRTEMPGAWNPSWDADSVELDDLSPAEPAPAEPAQAAPGLDVAAVIRASLEAESEVAVDPAAVALPASRPGSVASSLEAESEVAVDPAAVALPASRPGSVASLSGGVSEVAVDPAAVALPASRPGSVASLSGGVSEVAVDPAAVALPASRPGTPASVVESQQPGWLRRTFNGDEAKMTGAALAVAGPGAGLANNANPSFGLMAGATGGASLTAFGDAMSEVVKAARSPEGYKTMNWGKLVGGVLAFGGLVTAAPSIAEKVPHGRAAGMLLQGVGLLIKSYGEGYRLEKGSTALSGLPDGDIAKAAGNFVAAVAPILQGAVYLKEPELGRMLTSDALAAGTTGSRMLKAALYFTVGSGAGDFASEVVKGVKEGRVNPGKAFGGLLQSAGALTFANGAVFQNLRARNGGLYLQALGLAAKSAGEGIKLEDTSLNAWPSRRRRTAPATTGANAV
ncbi:hypothetical protein [Actinoplanes teichomyceticus]|uniref:hypothetical protein n=1 Tax=Actinoplanes teichomyceticus TaxID=1867 RepID=UPI0016568CD5|nr:hypothetical protein [Actinoplanes teichomyceticus]